ncbi:MULTISPECIES: deoxyribodipyrimidine photo-lyase [Pseudomonadati]|uniref:Deoxyribodipyrimidine photo-lyase n=1 Tax=Shewanella aestuarii TaxID=1028752 RepID=A0ABT0KZL4_9GAMM|nr:deoxyribodipyrimidine photo-lyase [Shewanella aestuarii]MCL1116904.1 deoxyribodipyrimidine photo-lyase [Shewanella aestuarii]GGN78444.1 deoxyribodipyrimidine photo-lyase [Shewanella aestuarii]
MQLANNSVVWFRQDLRIHDHPALTQACDYALEHNANVTAIYFVTPKQWTQHDVAAIQIDFIERHVGLLNQSLAAIGIELTVVNLSCFGDILPWLQAYCAEHHIGQIFAANEPEFNERQRDQKLISAGLPLRLIEQDCVLAAGSVNNLSGQMYKVFTPFSKAWKKIAASQSIMPLGIATFRQPIPLPVLCQFKCDEFYPHRVSSEQWAAGEDCARKLLKQFIESDITDYQQYRDFPAIAGTSKLSPYLAIGVLSARQCVAAILFHYPDALVNEASPAKTWLNELIWREFYRHLLVAFPKLSRSQSFNELGQYIQWRNDNDEFQAWCQGLTGYPIVDAAMRQLNQTGWMHNRLRMVVASFLTKHLLIDWRWGEQYFRQQLIDGDLAANNGGWQWSAGTGCDAQPYFRVFNPMTQSSKFDPDASFIKQFVPEVAGWSLKHIHEPHLKAQQGNLMADLFSERAKLQADYPAPIVEHSFARKRAIEVLGALKRG